MTRAYCFNCGFDLPVGVTMEELLEDELPIFCSIDCSEKFPAKYTKEFNERLNRIRGNL